MAEGGDGMDTLFCRYWTRSRTWKRSKKMAWVCNFAGIGWDCVHPVGSRMRRRRQHLCSTVIGRNRAPKANGVQGGDNVRKHIQSHLINHIRHTSGRQRAEGNLDFRCCPATTRQSIAHHLRSELQVRDKMQVRDRHPFDCHQGDYSRLRSLQLGGKLRCSCNNCNSIGICQAPTHPPFRVWGSHLIACVMWYQFTIIK